MVIAIAVDTHAEIVNIALYSFLDFHVARQQKPCLRKMSAKERKKTN